MAIAYLGLGSNLGERQSNIKQALDLLNKIENTSVKKMSEIIETEPIGAPGQGKYLNAACEIHTVLSPQQLLKELKTIEKKLGRQSTQERWGPREIDLDILFYDNKVIDAQDLNVPHPRLAQRYFMLKPLSQIAPGFVHPKLKKTVIELLNNLKGK